MIFEAKYNKRKKLWKKSEKYRKKSEKYRNLSEKIEKNRTNEISVHFSFRGSPKKRYFGEISAEKTEIFVHGYLLAVEKEINMRKYISFFFLS